MATQRSLGLAGAPTARDLGGLATVDGRRVRAGLLVRAGALGRLTDADLPELAKLGLACRIDLRHPGELAVAPPDRLPEPVPRLVRLPIYDQEHPVFTYVSAILLGRDLTGYAGLAANGTAAAMAEIYRWFVTGAPARAGFAAALRVLADPANLPALFHCSAGKDRTGWLTVVLLTALGVEPDAVREDYLRTDRDFAATRQALLDALRQRRPHGGVDGIVPALQARPEYLDAAFAEVARCFGSFDDYLRVGLGLDGDVLAALRGRLLA